MYDLENITVRELFHLEEAEFNKYFRLSQLLLPKGSFKKNKSKNIRKLTFGEVSELKRIFQKPTSLGLTRAFSIMFNAKEMWVMSSDVVSFFYAMNHIGYELKKLIDTEIKLLSTDPDPLLEQAGIAKVKTFVELPAMINFGERFGKKPDDIETWPYNLVLSILAYDNFIHQVQKVYNELKQQQNGRS